MTMPRITRVVTGPTVEPVRLNDVLDHLRLSESDHEPQIASLLQAARERIEEIIGRSLVQQTRAVQYPDWPGGGVLELPYPPIQSVTHVKYTDTDATEYTLSTDDYSVDTYSEPGRVVLKYGETWPSVQLHQADYPIVITYVAGYDDDGSSPPDYRANIPAPIVAAIKMEVELRYDRPPEAYAKQLKDAIDALLTPYKVWRL